MSLLSQSKKLAIKLRAYEESYITGQLDLNETLDETERLWSEVEKKIGESQKKPENLKRLNSNCDSKSKISASEILLDSDLMRLQTGYAKRSAKFYKPDSLVFNPTEFSINLKQYYDRSAASQSSSESSSTRDDELLWLELGNVAKNLLYTVPSFSFLYGTFDPDPVEIVKKKRKLKEKEKVGDVTRPISTNLKDSSDNKDPTITEAERVLGILERLCRKNEDKVICLYEFVTDPTSFVRTVENVFILSLLVKEGCVRIIKDRNGLPCLSCVNSNRRESNPDAKQFILSMSVDEWKEIVKQINLKKPLIPPRRTIL